MSTLILASLAFLLTHLGISSTPLRGALVGAIGENGYLGLYTVISFAALGAMIYAWLGIEQSAFVWVPGLTATAVARALMPFSTILVIAGVMSKNPTSVKMDSAVNQDSVDGILKITRHPLQWGIFLWAVAHVIGNGDQASIVFFGTFALLSGLGTFALDRKYGRREGDAWRRFFATTSNIPLAALFSGKNRLAMSELNWVAIGIGVVLFVLLYVFHDWVSGVALF